MNRRLVYFICIVSAMGGLLFGYDWVVIGGAKPFYEAYFGISRNPGAQGFAMSIALVGCLVGAMSCGFLADRIGRKRLLTWSAVIFLVSAYMTGAVDSFRLFLSARLLGGVGIGLASGLSPMYIAEIAPASLRGRLVSLNQLTIVIGILAAQIVNMLIAEPIGADISPEQIAQTWNGQEAWRWMFWGATFPAGVFLILSFFIPDSPRWLMLQREDGEAYRVLERIGGKNYAIAEEKSIINALNEEKGRGGLRMLFSRPFRRVLMLGIIIAVFQQWCGTNVIFNYAQEIFTSAGYELGDLFFQIVITGITNLIFTFVAINTVDKLGRRTLMLIGAGGLAGIYLILGSFYFLEIKGVALVVLVILAIGCYAMSLGPVTWVLLSEIFPDKVRGIAMSVCTFALWLGSATLTFSFPYLNSFLGPDFTFWIYSLICSSAFIYFTKHCPETKGKSLEALQEELVKS